ncbi:MAG: hypothetical protein WC460_05220 [Patescibacteria group bacterium]
MQYSLQKCLKGVTMAKELHKKMNDEDERPLLDGKNEYIITSSDRFGKIHESIVFAQNCQQAEEKFKNSLLGAKRTLIETEEIKIAQPIIDQDLIAAPYQPVAA